MKICVAGRNTLAIQCLKYIISLNLFDKHQIVALCSRKDLGIDNWEPSFKHFSIENNIEILNLEDIYSIPDLYFFSLQYDRIIRPQKFLSKKLFNIHFALLPQYKGMYTSIIPILNGEKNSGVTLHLIDEGIDTGDIIDQISIPIELNDTSRDLYFKYLDIGFQLFVKNFNKLLYNEYQPIPQKNINSTYFSKSFIDFSNIKIEFNKTSYEIHNQIRAYIFKEYQLPQINEKKIIKSVLTEEKINKNSVYEEGNYIIVSGIDGFKIQLEFK